MKTYSACHSRPRAVANQPLDCTRCVSILFMHALEACRDHIHNLRKHEYSMAPGYGCDGRFIAVLVMTIHREDNFEGLKTI